MKTLSGQSTKTLLSTNMSSNTGTMASASNLKEHISQLKEEFDKKYQENEVSQSSEKLKEYKFLAILGQGAFGLVVIYHSSFSFYFKIWSQNDFFASSI